MLLPFTLLIATTAAAEIVELRIESSEPFADGASFGDTGPYQRITGVAIGELDPKDPRNSGIALLGEAPRNPLGRFYWNFEYKPEDHDEEEKTFLGHTGNFNGEDIMGIIVDQPASPRFLARHLYRFFVADEVQVSSWNTTPPIDPEAIEMLVEAYNDSKGDIRSILRVLFNSDFFKNSQFAKVKLAGRASLARTVPVVSVNWNCI